MAEGKRTDVIALFDVDGTLTEPRKVRSNAAPTPSTASHVAGSDVTGVCCPVLDAGGNARDGAVPDRPPQAHSRGRGRRVGSREAEGATRRRQCVARRRASPRFHSRSSLPPLPVVNEVDYSFSENGLVAYHDGKQIHSKVGRDHNASPAGARVTSRARPARHPVRRQSRTTWATSASTSSSTTRCATSPTWSCR